MTPKTAYRISLAAGLAVLLLTIVSVTLPPPKVCGGLQEGYAPIVAFELARSVADLQALFGTQDDACRRDMVAAMDSVNWIDVFLYIPLYGSFLIFFLLGAREICLRPSFASLAIWIVAISCLADYVENAWLFRITDHPDIETGLFGLGVSTSIKWVGLGIGTALGGYLFGLRGGFAWLVILPCSAGLAVSLWSLFQPNEAGPLLSPAFALGWTVLLGVDAFESLRTSNAMTGDQVV